MWATMCSTVRSSGEPGAGSPPADGRVVAASMADDEAGPNPDVRERAYVGERCPTGASNPAVCRGIRRLRCPEVPQTGFRSV